jgi:phosphoserine phosphatase RsbX
MLLERFVVLVDIFGGKRPYPGEELSGDQFGSWKLTDNKYLLCLVDGLGHGPEAYSAACACVQFVEKNKHKAISEILIGCNEALKATRGVAVSLIHLNLDSQSLTFSGVGNVEACVISDKQHHLLNYNGIIGGENDLKPYVMSVPFEPENDMLLMYTDGINSPFDHHSYNKKLYSSAQKIVKAILDNEASSKDDAGVIVVV